MIALSVMWMVLGAQLGAALGDVAVADALVFPGEFLAVVAGVERVHVEFGGADEVARSGERRLVLVVVADDVAGVLAQEALDALAEFLRALDVNLLACGNRPASTPFGGANAGISRAFW